MIVDLLVIAVVLAIVVAIVAAPLRSRAAVEAGELPHDRRIDRLEFPARAGHASSSTSSCGRLFSDRTPSSVTTTMSSIRAPQRPGR